LFFPLRIVIPSAARNLLFLDLSTIPRRAALKKPAAQLIKIRAAQIKSALLAHRLAPLPAQPLPAIRTNHRHIHCPLASRNRGLDLFPEHLPRFLPPTGRCIHARD
jgi:hypothetical protein